MTAFVTGATGKVGHALLACLEASGTPVVGLTRSEDKARELEARGHRALVGSLADENILEEGISLARVVYHLAGGVRGRGLETPDLLNRQGTAHLASALGRAAHDDLEAVVFASTVAVYGDRSGLWLTEDMPTLPQTRYARSKVEAEELLLEAAGQHGLSVRIARLAGVYGPGFPILLAGRIQEGKAWLPGEGRNVVPMVHVEDAARALELIARKGQDGGIYNVADQHPLSLKEFYGLVAERVGGQPPRFWSTWVPSYVQTSAARRYERLMSRLGGSPRITPDTLKLWRASSRQSVERLDKELGFEWRWPHPAEGIADCLPSGPGTP